MDEGRKPRADAKLRNLPAEQRTALTDWLVDEGITYEEALKRLQKEFGIKSSLGAICDFYKRECFGLRFRKAASFADQIVDTLKAQSDGSLDEAVALAMRQRFFDLAVSKDANLSDLETIARIQGDTVKLELKKRDLEQKERKLVLLEKKAAQADDAANVAKSDQTPEEKERAIKAIFGITA